MLAKTSAGARRSAALDPPRRMVEVALIAAWEVLRVEVVVLQMLSTHALTVSPAPRATQSATVSARVVSNPLSIIARRSTDCVHTGADC